jgi:peptide/nickel transport system substrate-binding protein
MQTLVHDQVPFLPLYYPKVVQAYRTDKFAGFVNMPGGVIMFGNIWTFLNVHPLQGRQTPTTATTATTAPSGTGQPVWIAAAIVIIIAVIATSIYAARLRKQKPKGEKAPSASS